MTIKRVGILGAGKVGIVLAGLALDAGYEVRISGSGAVEKIALTIKTLVPGAIASENADVVANSDIIILAIALSRYKNIDPALLKGKLVIDAMNYWWETDGIREEVLDPSATSSEQVQAYFKSATIVKTFNHMGYHNLQEEARPRATRNARPCSSLVMTAKPSIPWPLSWTAWGLTPSSITRSPTAS